MEISAKHKELKDQSYWNNLSNRETGKYSQQMIDILLNDFFHQTCNSILYVGCGTDDSIIKYKSKLKAKNAVCIDYDTKIIEQMRSKKIGTVQWQVADIFNLENWSEKYDLIFLCDMLHEVYSFYGRPEKDLNLPINHLSINHQLGLEYVTKAISNLACLINQGGGIIITDNILCKQTVMLKIRMKREEVIKSIKYFLQNYHTRIINADIKENNILYINSIDFSVLLTQYNKIKIEDWNRWNIERLETHQYMNIDEYEHMFSNLGFITHAIIGTPNGAYKEWCSDFEILDGLSDFPEKRITLLAIKS